MCNEKQGALCSPVFCALKGVETLHLVDSKKIKLISKKHLLFVFEVLIY